MAPIKGSSLSRSTRLATHTSPYHASVTLFKVEDSTPESDFVIPVASTRRSKRLRKPLSETESAVKAEDTLYKKEDPMVVSEAPGPSTVSRPKSPRKPKPIQQSLKVPHPAPPRWRETYDTIKEMRSHIVAPVDTMGCDQAQLKESDPKSQRFSTLVSLMLSSQTKDEVTDAAVAKLREAVGGSLTVDAIISVDESTVSEAIAKVGFWRRKTQYIKQTALRLRDEFDSDVPKTVDELCSLPGVGPKMAFLALQVAWKLNVGIGVDVHVHRITNRLGWHQRPTKNPEETRLNLQSWLPTELHPEINHMLVGFGQMVCLPVGPLCGSCRLSSLGLCPSAQGTATAKKRKTSARMTVDEPIHPGPKVEIAIEEERLVQVSTD
ncbi:hypothetical protein SERLADRAFT_475004 [Serpula lacrymans var. lacrymans S7.9]|nr:uncharacterized protein SERLADRAFT_475004 [Serpula lacrymans var. lacrymans S7.9]EGO21942.1 hypothetical protein SERLADRAFT_475004 [Serpula lacrymans var. lacrymans S7.9]